MAKNNDVTNTTKDTGHGMIEVFCEWDIGCGINSTWDDLDSAQEYFKDAFKTYSEDLDYTYEEALKDGLLTFTDLKANNGSK